MLSSAQPSMRKECVMAFLKNKARGSQRGSLTILGKRIIGKKNKMIRVLYDTIITWFSRGVGMSYAISMQEDMDEIWLQGREFFTPRNFGRRIKALCVFSLGSVRFRASYEHPFLQNATVLTWTISKLIYSLENNIENRDFNVESLLFLHTTFC